MSTKFDLRQSVLRFALNMVGSAANATADTIFPNIDSELAKLFEDRNITLTGGGLITVNSTATSVTFGSALTITVNSQVAGGSPTAISVSVSTIPFTNDGNMLYAIITRTGTPSASVVSDSATLPAVTSANQEVFLIAKRIGTSIYFRNGLVILAGQIGAYGGAGVIYQSTNVDSTSTGSNTTISALTSGTVRLTNGSLVSISGIPAATQSQFVTLVNNTGNTVIINNDDSGATAANRIYTGNNATFTLLNYGTITLMYDTALTHWIIVGVSGASLSAVPTGTINAFGGTTAPSGFLMCDGSAVSRTTYSNLFSTIGNSFGSGDGSTTFNLPDLRYNFLRGAGPDTTATGSGTATASVAAKFVGIVSGMSSSVTITANNAGNLGNYITLIGTGSQNINGLITAWNLANPTNTITLTSGVGTQVPNSGAFIQTSGGVNSTATFNSHGFTHSGLRVRVQSGTLTGLTTFTDYYLMVVDSNTLSFCNTRADSLNSAYGKVVNLSGTNSAIIRQSMDQTGSSFQVTISVASPTIITSYTNQTGAAYPHNLNPGDTVYFNSTATLPTGILANTAYTVSRVPSTSTFTICNTAISNAEINVTGAGSGTFTAISINPRQALQSGGNTGANVGSFEQDQIQGTGLSYNVQSTNAGGNGTTQPLGGTAGDVEADQQWNIVNQISDGLDGAARVGWETRPRNVYVNYIIAI